MLRLFVGLALPPDLQQNLAALCCGIPNMRWVQPHTLPDLWVDHFVLFRSHLIHHGADYSTLAEYSLLG